MLLGLDCTHLDAGDVSFEALCCAGGEKPQEVPVAFMPWGCVERVDWPTMAFGGAVVGGPAMALLAALPMRLFSLGAAFCFQFLTVCSLFSPDPPQSSTL